MRVVCREPNPESPDFPILKKIYDSEIITWDYIYDLLKEYIFPSKKESSILLFRDIDRDNMDSILNLKKTEEPVEVIEYSSDSDDGKPGDNKSDSKEDSGSESKNSGSLTDEDC